MHIKEYCNRYLADEEHLFNLKQFNNNFSFMRVEVKSE